MQGTRSKIGLGGRVVIPSRYRKALGIKPGDEVLVRLEDGEIRILTPRQALARAQGLVRRYVTTDQSLVDELLADRRREAERE